MNTIDTHFHIWDPAVRRYPWLATPGLEILARTYNLDDYQAAFAGTGVSGSVFVECDPHPEDALLETQAILALARSPGANILGVVAHLAPESPTFTADLDALLSLPDAALIKGVRRVLHTQADELSREPSFRRNLQKLTGAGLSFDLCVLGRQLPLALELASECPEVPFILDHCGVPDVKGGDLNPWREHLGELAALPNVSCKISGIVAHAGPDWQDDDLRPYIESTIAHFGWDRVLFGGDWPVCLLGATFHQWHEGLQRILSTAKDDELERLFHRNARRIYRLE